MPGGRPPKTEWTQDIVRSFEDGILEGISISALCLELGIAEKTFYRKRMEQPEFDTIIARAQEMASDANIDRTEELARTATAENWQVVQFQCRNAQWIAGKRKAKKYGDRLQHTGADEGPIQVEFRAKSILEEQK